MESIVVTGGAGFIGSNFVRLALAATPDRVVVVDKLTYAGHLRSLADVAGEPALRLRARRTSPTATRCERVFAAHRPRAVLNFAAETHVDRSIDGPGAFVDTNVVGTFELLEASRAHVAALAAGRRARRSASCTSPPTRSTARSARRASSPRRRRTRRTRRTPRRKAAADHLVRAYRETYGLADAHHELLEQLRAVPVPREAHPAHDPERARGQAAARSTATAATCATGSTSRTTARASCSSSRRARPASKYNIGGGNERTNLEIVDALCAALERSVRPQRTRRFRRKGMRALRAAQDLRAGSARPRPPLRDRRRARSAASSAGSPSTSFEAGLLRTVRWYLEQPGVVRGGAGGQVPPRAHSGSAAPRAGGARA